MRRAALSWLLVLVVLGAAGHALAQPVDLLRATRTDLAVSSAYRDRLTQAAALVDGDLETAWNSRTGDLVGAWIEVRLPEDASVTSIALTVGFTRQNGQNDLFTGNHRVSRVRVLRAGREVGTFDLNPDSRALQTIPVTGPGGVYRIEIAGVVPGTQARWREVCVSELRVLGQAPGARAGERFPRIAVRALPAPRPAPTAPDRADVQRRLRDMTRRFATEWGALNQAQGSRRRACALDENDQREGVALRARRQRFLLQLAELVERVDEVRSDGLRAAAYARADRSSWDAEFLDGGDHDVVNAGLRAVVDWLAEDDARCRWASAEALLRLGRAGDEIGVLNHACEHHSMDYPEGAPRELRRECAAVERILPRIEELGQAAQRSLRSTDARLRRFELPELSGQARPEWTAMLTALETARRSCGWN